MSNLQDYVIVLNSLIEDQKKILGKMAIDKAQKIEGISLDENGMVISIAIDPQEALSLLMGVYKQVLGESVEGNA